MTRTVGKRSQAAQPAAPAPAVEEPGISLGLASAIYLGLAVVYFLPAFLPGRHIYGTDYLVGGYFFHEFISEQFASGQLPKWVPYVYGGLPLFANPGSTYHPVRFLADWLFPVSRIWPTFFVVHFALAGIGMYLLARAMDVRRWVAFLGGLAFQFTGITMSWVLAGHEGRIIVATLTPLVFYFFQRGIRTGQLAPFVGAAATIGSALLTFQIQNSYYLLLGAMLWSVFCLWHFGLFREPRRLAKSVLLGVAAVAFAFAMAAVNFLPFLDYVAESPRGMTGGRGYEYSVSYSMPVAEVAALAVPELSGYLESYRGANPFKLHVEYVGAFVLLLAALGFVFCRRSRYWWFFVGLGLFALTISLGGNTPIYRLYYEIFPGYKRFRAPSIAFFLVSLSLVAMATLALEAIAAAVAERRQAGYAKRTGDEAVLHATAAGWVTAGVVAVGVLLGIAASGVGPNGVAPGAAAFQFALFAAAIAGVLWFWMQERLKTAVTVALLAVLAVADLWIVDRDFFETVPSPEEMFAPDDVAMFLRAQPGQNRVWVLPFPPGAVYRGQAGNYLMHYDVDQAGGEHGNQLQRYNEYVGAGQETYVDWHNFLGDPTFLNAANVRYIVSGAEFQDPRLREVHRGSALVYENLGALPRVWLAPEVITTAAPDGALALMRQPGFDPRRTAVVNAATPVSLPGAPDPGTVELTEYTPDRVVVRTTQRAAALLVLADNLYKGWTASVDGRAAPILRTNHTFRGVVVPAGEHEVVFRFRPADLYTGLYIYLATLALVVGYALFLAVRVLRSRWSRHAP